MTEHGFDRAARLLKEARSNAEVTLDDPRVSETIRKTFDGTAEAVEVDWQAGPLDPSKVKAGDTAEIRSGEAVVRDIVTRTEFQPRGVILWFEKLPGGYWVDDADDEESFRLTAHQPAPEPEPEWKPGEVALVRFPGGEDDRPNLPASYAQIDGPDGEWRALNGECADYASDVHVIRPLVVIDPAVVDVDHLVDVGSNTDDPRTNTLAILAGLGIEAP